MTEQEEIHRFARKLGMTIAVAIGLGLLVVLKDLLILTLEAVVLASALAPFIEAAERRRIPRPVTVIVLLAGILGAFALFLVAVVPTLISQGSQLANALPSWLMTLPDRLPQSRLLASVIPSANAVIASVREGLLQGVGIALHAASSLGNLFLVGLITVMLMLDSASILRGIARLLPEGPARSLETYWPEMSRKMAGYVAGVLITSLILALACTLILRAIGVPYALLLGVTLGIVSILPVVGGLIGLIPAVVVAFFVSLQVALWTAVALFVLVQAVGVLVGPIITRRTVDLHPLVVLFAVTLGFELGGLGGAIIAVPLAACGQVLLEHLYLQPKQDT